MVINEAKVKTAIKELRDVIMDLYRSAGNLDMILQDIELQLFESNNIDAGFYCSCKRLYRDTMKKEAGFNNLDTVEAEAWSKLLEAIHEEEKES